jgi:hypothetical protein
MGFYLAPLMTRMHEMGAWLPHEELQLSAVTFRSFLFEGLCRVPSYQRWYASRDHHAAYLELRQLLQLLSAGEGAQRWLLKSPQHLEQIGPMLGAFPDAKVIRTHRDPVRAALSLATMLTYSRRALHARFDAGAEARSWVDRIEQMLRRSVEQERLLPSGQVMDLRFHEFIADPFGCVKRAFDFAGRPLDRGVEAAVRGHLAANPRGGKGSIAYRFEALGLDAGEMRERLRFYQEHFDLPEEDE